MCKYGIKTGITVFGMRAAIAKRFSGDAAPELFRFFVFQSVSVARRVLVSAARQRRRRVSKTSTRLALTPVYLPYITRIFGVNGYFGAKTLRFTAIRRCLS